MLGRVGAWSDETALELGAPKQRAVLATLLAHPNQIVSVGQIISAVWGEEAPEAYRRSIHTYVSNLRALLGTAITRVGDGYRLEIESDQIDALLFEELMKDSRNLIATDPMTAAARLREALAMWHGRPYADIADTDGLQAEVTRLEELRLTAVELRFDAELSAGHHQQIIAEVGALAEEYPLRERFRAQHMIALYRSGRQVEALRAFERTREYLSDELGLDPSQELQDLELSVLRHDHELRRGTGWATTQHLAFLASDIEGFEEAWDRNPQAMAETLAVHDRILAEAVTAAHGRVFRQAGEGIVAAFSDVRAAVGAAEQAQRDLADVDFEPLEELKVGMAIDVGEAEARGGDFQGPPVTRASRLAAAARGGQVLVSAAGNAETVRLGVPGLQVKQLGEHELAGFAKPEQVGQLVFDGVPSAFSDLRDVSAGSMGGGEIPLSLPGYEIRDRIAEGALGVVYRGYQPSVGREVAIKVIASGLASHPRFIHRFEAEARVIARLAHPHIVPLIDFWRDAEGAYLVLQFMPGGTLREAMAEGSLEPSAVLRVLHHLAGGLSHAHDQGVVHGDLRPENVLLDGSGNAYLFDFDITSRLLDPELIRSVSAAPEYRAPELSETGPTVATDIYALGMIARQLIEDPRAFLVLSRATATEPDARDPDAVQLVVQLEEALGGDQSRAPEPEAVRNPYKGLRAFEEADATDFHGRDELVEKLAAVTASRRFVTVVGPSGSGKSSVVRAGLLPALSRGAFDGSDRWLHIVMTPGSHPLQSLVESLESLAPQPVKPETLLVDEGLESTVDRLLEDVPGELVVVIDQFEEVFTLVNEPERKAFVDTIVDAVESDRSRVRVVTTLRADLYDRPLSDSRLGPHIRDGQVTVVRPTYPELVEMIVAPSDAAGLRWEPGLAHRIAREVIDQPGGLPLLQFALTELVENRRDDFLDTSDYERVGGVAGALAGRAEAVYDRLPPRLQEGTRNILLRLVTVDENSRDARRRVRLSELESMGLSRSELDRILTPFITERLLLSDRDPSTRGPTVEVAHEALLREWPRLWAWVEEERESLILTRKLRAAMDEWEGAGRHPDYLPTGSRLVPFQPLAGSSSLASDERSFLETAREDDRAAREMRQRRRRLFTGLLTGVTAVALILAGIAFSEGRKAAVEAERATAAADLARARELSASAINVLGRDPELSVLLASQATEVAEPTFESVSALHEALYHHRLIWTVHWTGDSSHFTGALSPDGTRLALAGTDRIEVWDVEERILLWELDLPSRTGLGITPFFTRDGAEIVGLVTWPRLSPRWEDPPPDAMPGIYSWDAVDGEQMGFTPGGECPIWDIGQYGPSIDPAVPILVAGFGREGTGAGCAYQKGMVSLLDLHSGATVPVAEIPLASYRSSLSTSADARFVAFTDSEVARIIDAATGAEVTGPSAVWSATLGPDGSYAIMRQDDGSLIQLDVDTNSLARQFGAPVVGERIQLDVAGTRFVHYHFDGDISIWNLVSGDLIGHLVGAPAPAARMEMGAMTTSMSSDGSRIASFSGDGSARVWSAAPLGELGSFPVGTGFITAGSLTLGGDRGALLIYPDHPSAGRAVVFDVRTGETLTEISDVTGQTIRLSPDGTRVAAQLVSEDAVLGPVQIHDLESGLVTPMEGMCQWPDETEGDPQLPCVPFPDLPFQEWARDMSFSPDGTLLALSGAVTGSISIWTSDSGEMIFNSGRLMPPTESDPHFDGPTLAFTPDGEHLAVSTRDELMIYATDSWQVIGRTPMERMTRMVFGPGGSHLVGVTPSPAVAVIDVGTWRQTMSITGHNGHVHDLAVGPDARVIASSDVSGVIRIWDLETGSALQEISLGDQSVQNVEFLDPTHLIVTPRGGPNAIILTIDVDELQDIAHSRVTRPFTTEECRVYLRVDTCPSVGMTPER